MRTSVEDGFLLPLPRCSQLGNVSHKYATNPTNSNAKSRILQMPTSHHNTTTTGIADNSNSHQSCQKRVLCSDKDTNCRTHILKLFHTSNQSCPTFFRSHQACGGSFAYSSLFRLHRPLIGVLVSLTDSRRRRGTRFQKEYTNQYFATRNNNR